MHGTGTALGDPIEVGAALAVLHNEANPLSIMGVKAQLGHAEACAGANGMLQVSM